jgi:DNA polymerase
MDLALRATIDFESRSACSLRKSGTWRYSLHPTTQVLCLGFRLPYWEEGRTGLWHPAFPTIGVKESSRDGDVEELIAWIEEGGMIEAHSAWFEFCLWRHQLVPKHRFPPIQDSQWRCSAAKAAAHSLPRGLDHALQALISGVTARLTDTSDDNVPLGMMKDREGALVMRKVSQPRKPRKKELEVCQRCGVKPKRYYWHESRKLFARLWDYCRQDVLAEESLSQQLPDLSDAETKVFMMDRAINERGFQLDVRAVDTALRLIAQEERILNHELAKLTEGKVKRATQRQRMLSWLATKGVHLPDTKAETVQWARTLVMDESLILFPDGEFTVAVAKNAAPEAFQALGIMKELGRSSTAKYEKMQQWMDERGRVRGGLLYHGASTGRWSGQGVQPHNFVRGSVKDVEGLWDTLKTGTRLQIADFPLDATEQPVTRVGSVMDALANGLRGAIVASPGHQLYVADYSSIEARVLLWVAGDKDGLDIFRSGRDIYCEMASEIYGRTITKADKNERQVGKTAILGLGYQMGWPKFKDTAKRSGSELTDEFAERVVDAYRTKFWRVKHLWADQNAGAVQAVQEPGRQIWVGKIRWKMEGRFLYCTLPSGRRLAYPDPEVRMKTTPWGEDQLALTYKGIHPMNHNWVRTNSYGGMLVENIVQAISRDLMADAMLRIENSGMYHVVLTVHDEIIAESEEGDLQQFEHLMATCPPWALDCPVAVEGWTGPRYKK